MWPEVMEIVAGVRSPHQAAELAGFRRAALRAEVYPALVPEPGAAVRGVLWRGLDAAALARVDRFEGELYERLSREVACAGGERYAAEVYVLRPERRALALASPWDEENFGERHLAAFLETCRAFAREVEVGGSKR